MVIFAGLSKSFEEYVTVSKSTSFLLITSRREASKKLEGSSGRKALPTSFKGKSSSTLKERKDFKFKVVSLKT